MDGALSFYQPENVDSFGSVSLAKSTLSGDEDDKKVQNWGTGESALFFVHIYVHKCTYGNPGRKKCTYGIWENPIDVPKFDNKNSSKCSKNSKKIVLQTQNPQNFPLRRAKIMQRERKT